MAKLHKLPGNRGSYKAKTEKRTLMFSYQIVGSESEIQQYSMIKEAEGYSMIVDVDYGPIFLSNRNIGVEGILDIIADRDTGELRAIAYNPKLREIEELVGVVSDSKLDDMRIEALTKGNYAKKISVKVSEEQGE